MDPQKATWNDIERALNSGTLESLDRATLEAFAQVEPPSSQNPAFHARFTDAKQRIYRALDEHKRNRPDDPGSDSEEERSAHNVALLDEKNKTFVFSNDSRRQFGLPSAAELDRLPATFRQALALRCALRVAPLLAARGALRFWPDAIAKESMECLIRALQSAVVNCTDNPQRSDELKHASVLAESEAKRARRVAQLPDARSADAMAVLALAANGGELQKIDLLLNLLVRNQFFYSGFAEAVSADFQRLSNETGPQTRWPAPGFYREPLWIKVPPKEWESDSSSWNIALHNVGLAWAAGAFEGWKTGRFEIDETLRELTAWAARVPGRDDNDSASPELDDDEELAAPLRSDPPTPMRNGGTVEPHFGNDAVPTVDTLSRRKLAAVLATFLRDPRTRVPLTLSIEGTWGSGKTTFMRLLQGELETSAQPGGRPIRTLWFNPWRHQTQEELWAAFALYVTEAVASRLPWRVRWQKWRELHYRLFKWKEGWRDLVALALRFPVWLGAVVLGFLLLARGIVQVRDKDFLEAAIWGVGGLLTVLLAALTAWKKASELVGSPFEIDLKRHLARPNYEEKTSFLTRFQEHFRDFCRIYLPANETVVIFIDDLDRCDVPRAAELMQAINLMLSDDAPFVYVLGLDRAKVAAGIAVKNKELLPFLYARELASAGAETQGDALRTRGLEHGYEFIEKFIQLPFRIPPSEHQDLRGYIRGRLTLAPAPPNASATNGVSPNGAQVAVAPDGLTPPPNFPAVPPVAGAPPTNADAGSAPARVPDESHLITPLLFASPLLGGNPRRIAQLINLVRFQRLLAPVLGIDVTEGQLTKWTAVALRWPVLIADLAQEPTLLGQLLINDAPANPSPRVAFWRGNSELLNFLRSIGPTGDDPENYVLTAPRILDALLRLGVTVPLVDEGKVHARALAKKLL